MAYSHNSAISFNAPFFIGGLWGNDEELEEAQRKELAKFQLEDSNAFVQRNPIDYNNNLYYETRDYRMLELHLNIRQFDDHPTNANCVWPEASFLAEWLMGINVSDNNIIDITPEQEKNTCNSSIGLTTLNLTRFKQLLITPDELTVANRQQKRVLE